MWNEIHPHDISVGDIIKIKSIDSDKVIIGEVKYVGRDSFVIDNGSEAISRKDIVAIFYKYLTKDEFVSIHKLPEPSVLDEMIKFQELSYRVKSRLINSGVCYLGELCQKTDSEIIRIKGFGARSVTEIRELLKSKGLSTGMRVERVDWSPPQNSLRII